jgi:DnaJ-class molecular chaperone
MTDFDPFRELGLPPGADLGAVRRAYRRLARRFHPGLPIESADADRFRRIVEAYQRLAATLAAPPAAEALRTLARTFVLISQRPDPIPAHRWPVERELVVEVSFGEAVRGGMASVTLQREEVCPSCAGGGCPRCGGRGLRVRLERLRARIPAGIEDGSVLRLARRASEPGNGLHLRVKVREHAYFRREGLDVHADLPVTYAEAVLGAEVDVPTLDGPVRVRLPAGTRGGSRFRLAGRGVQAELGTGDHFYTVEIIVPTAMSEEEKDWIRRLPGGSPREGLPKAPVE